MGAIYTAVAKPVDAIVDHMMDSISAGVPHREHRRRVEDIVELEVVRAPVSAIDQHHLERFGRRYQDVGVSGRLDDTARMKALEGAHAGSVQRAPRLPTAPGTG